MQYSEPYSTDSTPLESNTEKRKRLIEYRLLGGDGLHDINGRELCSVGLWVRDSNGQDYIMTAGHCDFVSPRNQQGFVDFYQKGWHSLPTYNYIGPLEHNSYAPYDFGLIRHIGTNVTLTTIICNFDHPNIYPVLYVKNVGVVTSVGTSLCKSGETTHVTCGVVTEFVASATFRYPGSNYTDIKKEFFRTDIVCDSGDSGGPVFYYHALQIPYVLVAGTVIGGTKRTCDFLSIPVSFRAA
ncbi:1444_t:CDS:1, partial [Gigaspora margarita]